MQTYTRVELFPTVEELERRILKRDEIAGLIPLSDGGYEIVVQGNENQNTRRQAATIQALYELNASKEASTAALLDFGRPVHPLKSKLVNMLIQMIIMIIGMLIALGIVEEKQDNTINAINVTPLSRAVFIVGKSLVGVLVAMLAIVLSLLITGYVDINWGLVFLIAFSSMFLAMALGFMQGIHSEDIIEASSGVKLVMIPIAGSIAVYELVAENWQWTMFWSPFYWAYRVNDMILSKTVVIPEALLYSAFTFLLSSAVYLLYLPKIRKGLS